MQGILAVESAHATVMRTPVMTFASNLSRAMKRAGLTQEALADQMGISRPAVGQWLSGYTKPRGDRLDRLAIVLGVPTSDLFSAIEAPENEPAEVESRVAVGDRAPQPGDPIKSVSEAALVGLWRQQSPIKQATIIGMLTLDLHTLASLAEAVERTRKS